MDKWTPGPWKLKQAYINGQTMWTISGIATGIFNEADAHLIVAAPDLYEALRNIENDDGSIPATIWKMAQDAIAKAEGRDKDK